MSSQRSEGWVQTLIGIAVALSIAIVGFLYLKVLPVMADNIILNDKDSRKRDEEIRQMTNQNTISIAELQSIKVDISSIKEDMREFKDLFRRRYQQ